MTNDVEEKVRTVLADVLGLDPSAVGPDTSPDTVEAWDSLQHLNLVLAIEEEFDFQVSDAEMTELVSYPLIIAIVNEKLGTAEPST
jgi:acyl carrier protein